MKKRVKVLPGEDLFEISPYGVTVGFDSSRPILLFRDSSGDRIVPVYLSPLEAGIAITQDHMRHPGNSPHGLSLQALKALGVKATRCRFVELKGHHQYVEVDFEGVEDLKKVKIRADQAVSFCLHAKVPFYCSKSFFDACREATFAQTPVSKMENNHPYLN